MNNKLLVRTIGIECVHNRCHLMAKFKLKFEYPENSNFIYDLFFCEKCFNKYIVNNDFEFEIVTKEHYITDYGLYDLHGVKGLKTNFMIRIKSGQVKLNPAWKMTTKRDAKKLLQERDNNIQMHLGCSEISLIAAGNDKSLEIYLEMNKKEINKKDQEKAAIKKLREERENW